MDAKRLKFKVEVFDCPERGSQKFYNRESADKHRDSLIKHGVHKANIRIVAINEDGADIR